MEKTITRWKKWWKKQPRWKKITGLVVISLTLFLVFINHALLLKIIGWLGVIWRPETAIPYWKIMSKPLWQLIIIRGILDFWGLFLAWTLAGFALKITDLHRDNKFIQKLVNKFERKKENPKFQKRLKWFEKRGNSILYLLMFIPIVPGIPELVVMTARTRRMKYGLLIFGLINFVKNSLYLWLIWKGISFFSLKLFN